MLRKIEEMEMQIALMKSSLIVNKPDERPIQYLKIYPSQEDSKRIHPEVKQWYLITYTFAPKVLLHHQFNTDTQTILLRRILESYNNKEYYSCIEEHKQVRFSSEKRRFHMHLMIHSAYEPLFEQSIKDLRTLTGTNSRTLHPAIDIKPVKITEGDVQRTYEYIILDKPDHPKYKDLCFNIDKKKSLY